MLQRIIALFTRPPAPPLDRFLTRFAGRTLIVHAGLSAGWVQALLEEGGGAGHFRFDTRRSPGEPPTPVEWVVHRHLLPLGLPLPFLVKVETGRLLLRHLRRGDAPAHPSEIAWMLREMETRHHWRLVRQGDELAAHAGMDVADNRVEIEV